MANTTPVVDFTGYTAKTLSGADPIVPSAAQRKMVKAFYMNNIWMPGSTAADPRIDVAKVQAQANCLDWGTIVLPDVEWLIGGLKVGGGPDGSFLPNPDRLRFQVELVKLVDTIRSTPRGASATLSFFHTSIGSLNADNGGQWVPKWIETTQQVFTEAIPGSSSGIAGLVNFSVGQVYRRYRDNANAARTIALMASSMRSIFVGKPLMLLLQPRGTTTDFGVKYFDYLTKDQMASDLNACTGKCDMIGMWNSGHYGPEGWVIRDPVTHYAIKAVGSNVVVGDQWNETYGWVQALREWQGAGPVVTTIPYTGEGVSLDGGGVR